MNRPALPLIVEPDEVQQHIGNSSLLIVDLSKPGSYAQYHIPGAVHLEYAEIVTSRPPVMGLLPDADALSDTLSAIGATPDHHIIAYDDEGGAKASRFLWTLDVIGHRHHSLLNGGLHAWLNEDHATNNDDVEPASTRYSVTLTSAARVDKDYILANLGKPALVLLDTRSEAEFNGTDKRASRGGHIPGAINVDWTRAIDQSKNMRLRPEADLRSMYEVLGVTRDKEVITYCQTHHRSSHTYWLLRALGYANVKGYPGAWSEWGNSPDTPVE